MTRTILHLDLDAFFCAVEEQLNPALKGLPFAVGGRPDQRGVVASCSYAARLYGIHSAMPMSTAVRRCPELTIVPARFHTYREFSRRVMAILEDLTPMIEQISIDEAFLDVTGLPGSPVEIAQQLQQRINQELNLPCSLGAASSKLVAKIANNIGKSRVKTSEPPNAIEIVPPGTEAAYLAPLPVEELWGVGQKTAARLHTLGIHTIGDIAHQPEARLYDLFGKHGKSMWQRANGIDERPVETESEARSYSKETTFAADITDRDRLHRTLRQLSEKVGHRLRKARVQGGTVKIKLRWSDFTTITRQTTLTHPTDDDNEIYTTALALFEQAWTPPRPVRLIGVGVSQLQEAGRQLELWSDADQHRSRQLQRTLDELRQRFGDESVQRGSDIQQDD